MARGSGWILWVRLAGGECLVGVVARRYIYISSYYLSLLLLYLLFLAAASLLFCSFL